MRTLSEYINEALLDKNLIKRQCEIINDVSAWMPGDIVKLYEANDKRKLEKLDDYYVVINNEKKSGKNIYLQLVDKENFNKTIGEIEEFKITSFAGCLKKSIDGRSKYFEFELVQRGEKNKNPLRDVKTLKGGIKSALYFFDDYMNGGWVFDILTKDEQEYFDIDSSIRPSLKNIVDYTLKNCSQAAQVNQRYIGASWDPKDDDSNKSKKMWDKFRGESGSDYPVLVVLKDKQIPGPYLFVNYNDNITSINKDIQNFIDLFDREYVDVWVQVE